MFVHSSERAQAIGRKMLKISASPLGCNEQVVDEEVFLFKPVRIRMGIEGTTKEFTRTKTR